MTSIIWDQGTWSWSNITETTTDNTKYPWYHTTSASSSAVLDMLRPGVYHTYKLIVYAIPADTSDPVYIVFNGQYETIEPNEWVTKSYYFKYDRPLTLTIVNARQFKVRWNVTSSETIPANGAPWQVLALEALLPPVTSAARFNQSRFNQSRFNQTAPPDDVGIFGESLFNTARFNYTPAPQWQPILDNVTNITAQRGAQATGQIMKAEAGTLAITALNALDPRALGASTGTAVRLYHWPTRTPIFTGWLVDAQTTPQKEGGYISDWTASDDVNKLINITRYGTQSTGAETIAARVARLMKSAPDVSYKLINASTVQLCPALWETSLAVYLDATTATTGGYWIANRQGGITISGGHPAANPKLTLTDVLTTSGWHYHTATNNWAMSQQIASIKATNHGMKADAQAEDGQTTNDITATAVNTTIANSYGGREITLDTMLYAANDQLTQTNLEQLLEQLISSRNTTLNITRAAVWVAHEDAALTDSTAKMQLAATLDPVDTVTATSRGETSRAVISTLSHEISPTKWAITFDLIPERTTST